VNINKVILAGRIAKMFDLKYFDDGTPSLPITLATNEQWTDKCGARRERSDFHRVVLVGKAAEIVQTYAILGQELHVCGKLTHRPFGAGQRRQLITEVRVSDMDFGFGAKPRARVPADPGKAVESSRRP
jgi:single-strand DNA-binding protein